MKYSDDDTALLSDEIIKFLSLPRLPGRLTPEMAAPLLGFQAHDIPTLVRVGLLEPLGTPLQQAVKHFAAIDIERRARNRDWLNDATKAISDYWSKQNKKRKARPALMREAA
jgi:hypothetical protein